MIKFLNVTAFILIALSALCLTGSGAKFGAFFFASLLAFNLILTFCIIISNQDYKCSKFLKIISNILKILFILWLISFIIVETLIVTGKKSDDVSVDLIIVLGAGINYDTPSSALKSRLDLAYDYLLENPETKVMTTGGMGDGESFTEGYVSKKYLLEKGISTDRILTEETSRNTFQNIQNAKEILGDFSGTSAVISNDFHLFRARKLMELNDLDPNGIGTTFSHQYLDIIYNIREYFSVMKHFLFER